MKHLITISGLSALLLSAMPAEPFAVVAQPVRARTPVALNASLAASQITLKAIRMIETTVASLTGDEKCILATPSLT